MRIDDNPPHEHRGIQPQVPMPLPDDLAWSFIESMLLIRRFEEAVLRLSDEKASSSATIISISARRRPASP